MTPTTLILNRLSELLAVDPTTLAPAALALKVKLAMASFVPGNALTPGSFTEATFTGYAPLEPALGAQQFFYDPTTGQRVIQLVEPAGGWHWVTTGATGLPQTIFGWYVVDNAAAVLYGSGLFPTPVVLSAIGQGVDISQLRFSMANQPLS